MEFLLLYALAFFCGIQVGMGIAEWAIEHDRKKGIK
jgi:hypothetical protein